MTTNIEDIKPGDTVTLEHPDGSRLVGKASAGGLSILTETLGDHYIDALERRGWTITDHKPKVELPTEPGVYVSPDFTEYDADTTLWWFDALIGSWFTDASGSWDYADSEDVPSGLVRLVPESESRAKIAGEVIDWFWENADIAFSDRAHALRHFGVS